MTDPRSSDAQARHDIRSRFDRTLLVEASAGTGKTTEMVLRIVNGLGEGITTVDRFVAVTFTEKAAAELKLRLREQLDRARLECADGSRRQRLDQAVTHLEEAHINTIHGFCADLLRERPVEALVDPAFDILVGSTARRLFDRIFDEWLSEVLESPPSGVRRALVRRVSGEAENDAGPVEQLRRAAWEATEWRDFTAPWTRDPQFDRVAGIEGVLGALRSFVDASANPSREHDPLWTDTLFVRRTWHDIEQRAARSVVDLDEIESLLGSLARDRDRVRARQGSGASYSAMRQRVEVLGAREALFAQLDTFVQAADADLAALLHEELSEPVRRYEEAKTRAGQLDFLDLLVRARNLLRDNRSVLDDFQQRFDRILVDEFQDTDPIQAEILLRLCAVSPDIDDWRRVTLSPGKLFIVADPKQSIYRFRRADVGIYQDVKSLLAGQGVEPLYLSRSFRSVPSIQRFVNRVFAPLMREDHAALQAEYVPLEPSRSEPSDQPAVIALPIPEPYGIRNISGAAIDRSLPPAVAAFIGWLLNDSGWTVTERTQRGRDDQRVPIAARHVCLVFRRFESWGRDVTRPYVDALEARDVPHLLVGGRSFNGREEIDTIKTALCAIEWPNDELAVFATLHGPLFAFDDASLLRWREACGSFSPFNATRNLPHGLDEIAGALQTLGKLHRGRNRVPVAETIHALLEATRAHAGFVLRPSGEQALANVLHTAELARRFAASGGMSFRSFVEDLLEGRFGDESDAPILEEGGDGVRIMTVHKAKGLEFPVVVLCDVTANLASRRASRFVDASRELCAVRLAGCAPWDLLGHEAEEMQRDHAEGIRAAYVAATRARDVLVVPAVGDEPYDTARSKWTSVLADGLYPARDRRRDASAAPACPTFPTRDTVLTRPHGDAASPQTMAPGWHWIGESRDEDAGYGVTWWDPRLFDLEREPHLGLRETDLLSKDVSPAVVSDDLAACREWEERRAARLARGQRASLSTVRATERALEAERAAAGAPIPIEVVSLRRQPHRGRGLRYGSLVHAVLATVRLDAARTEIEASSDALGRLAGAPVDERHDAVDAVERILAHDLMAQAREAIARGRCHRESPVTLVDEDGSLVEGQVDLAFEREGTWQVVDFKTDVDDVASAARYRAQVALYARAIMTATGQPVRGWLVQV
ncbi:MAG: UvrD-helicase domain-containing protein [Vicinamibacterales bacterium]